MTFLIPMAGSGPLKRTFTAVGGSIASATFERHVIACFTWSGGLTPAPITGGTMAGVAASVLVNSATIVGPATASVSCAIISARIPAGSSGGVSASYSGTALNENYALYDVENWSGTLSDTSTSTAAPSSLPLSALAGSIGIGVVSANDSFTTDPTASASWSVFTEDADVAYGASNVRYLTTASAAFSAAASITPTCSHSHTGSLQTACGVILI